MRYHYTPSSIESLIGGFNRLSQSTDLVEFQQQSIRTFLLYSTGDPGLVGACQVICNNLNIDSL